MLNRFSFKALFLAKHAQHVALIHFPIALFISAVAFDFLAQRSHRPGWSDSAYRNLSAAALSTIPVFVTGVLAWQFQLEGQRLKGFLLIHVLFAFASNLMIWLAWWIHFRARERAEMLPTYRLAVEVLGVVVVALTGHFGGFVSGVNGLV
jgi:uncharacterized membrane protein